VLLAIQFVEVVELVVHVGGITVEVTASSKRFTPANQLPLFICTVKG
jgi:hypothetical protein